MGTVPSESNGSLRGFKSKAELEAATTAQGKEIFEAIKSWPRTHEDYPGNLAPHIEDREATRQAGREMLELLQRPPAESPPGNLAPHVEEGHLEEMKNAGRKMRDFVFGIFK